jgi:tetratricopeptide (TPR) repeat protein
MATVLLGPASAIAQDHAPPKTNPDKTPTAVATSAPEADFSREPVVYESVRATMRYENDGSGFCEVRARVHVQTDAGLVQAGQLVFPYNAENETVEIHSVRVLKPDGTSVTTGPENVQDLSSPVARLAPVYSDARQKHVTVSALSVGDTIEYDVAISSKPLDSGQFWQTYSFQSRSISLDDELELNVPKDRPLKIKGLDGVAPEIREEGDRRLYHWRTSNLTVPKPIDMLTNFKIDARRLLEGHRPAVPQRVVFSTFQSWADVGNWYVSLERDRREPTPAVRVQADEIVRDKTSDAEKAEALYDWVARNIRYVGLSFGVGRYQPHAAADVLTNRYGDCKDKTTLLEAFLEAEGIPASAALMNGLADVDLAVPTPLAFDHVITLASVAGKDTWLDPTVGAVPYGYLMPQLRSQNALVAFATGTPAVRETPKELPTARLCKLDVAGRINKDGNLDAIVKFSIRGDLEVLLRLFNSVLPPGQFTASVQEAMTKANRTTYGQSTFTDFRLDDAGDISKPLQGQFHFVGKPIYVVLKAITPESFVGSVYSALHATTDGIGWAGKVSPVHESASESKATDTELAGPEEYSLKVAVEVPTVKLSGAEKPTTSRISSEFGEFESSTKWDGQTLKADWRLSLHAAKLAPANEKDYATFRNNILDTLHEPETAPEVNAKSEAVKRAETTNAADATKVTASAKVSPAEATAPPVNRYYSTVPEAEALYREAEAEAKLDNYANAAQIYQSALKIDPKYPSAWRELGRSYMRIPDFPDAEAAFRKYLALSPNDHLAYLNMAWVLYDEKKYSEDVELLEKRVVDAPGDGDAHHRLGTAYLALHQPDRAVPELERAVEIFPKAQPVQYTLGYAYLETRQNAKAADAFQRAIDIKPTDLILNDASYELAKHGASLDVAEKWAQEAVRQVELEANEATLQTQSSRLSTLTRKLGMYWDTLGWVKFQQGDYEAAEKYIFSAWQTLDDSAIGLHLGRIYDIRGRHEEAAEIYADVLSNLPAKHEMNDDEKDASKRLADSLSNEPKNEGLVAAVRERLRSARSAKIDNKAQEHGIAQYLMLIDPDSKVIDMEPIGPDSGLAGLAEMVRAALMPQTFPDATIRKVPRLGTLACVSADQPCTLTLLSAGSAARVLPSAPE